MNQELIAEFQSSRTKSITFHPTKPIMLTSHHTSEIHAYDLHLNSLVYTFQGHDGPVRSVVFHPKTDLFISGGDDCKIILWSYSTKKQLHTFKGHTDYIRSLDFHPIQPWFLSTSDDQTIKIWNFQSYKQLSSLSGHSHYVMCGKFIDNFIVSCSLDQTLRIWDYDGLLKRKETNLLGVPNVVVKQIIDAHDRGINNIYKHKTKNLFLSCADDRQVKLWEYEDSIWEKEVYYSHSNNVCGVCFVKDYVISVGEDGLLNVEGKENKRLTFDTRIWCVATNKDESFYAVGYDSGIKVYATKKRKDLYCYNGQTLFYVRDDRLYMNTLEKESEIYRIKKEPYTLKCVNEGEYKDCVLIQYGSSFEIIKDKGVCHKGNGRGLLMPNNVVNEYKCVYSIDDESLLLSDTPNDLFFCSDKDFFIVRQKTVDLFDVNMRKIKVTWKINDIKKVITGENYIALLGKRKVVIVNRANNSHDVYEELTEIKNGFFEGDTFIYSTMRHIKYITSEFCGIFRSMEKEVHVLFKTEDFIFYISNETIENVKINLNEYNIIKAVMTRNDNLLKEVIESTKILSETMMNFIIKNGKGNFVSKYVDETKADILMEIGKLDDCFTSIEKLNDISLLEKLYLKSIEKKNIKLAEKCLWKIKDYTRLFYLYICINKLEKLEELKKYGDDSFKLNLGLFMKDHLFVKNILYKKKIIAEINTIEEIKEKYHIGEKVQRNMGKNKSLAVDIDGAKKDVDKEISVKAKEDNENRILKSFKEHGDLVNDEEVRSDNGDKNMKSINKQGDSVNHEEMRSDNGDKNMKSIVEHGDANKEFQVDEKNNDVDEINDNAKEFIKEKDDVSKFENMEDKRDTVISDEEENVDLNEAEKTSEISFENLNDHFSDPISETDKKEELNGLNLKEDISIIDKSLIKQECVNENIEYEQQYFIAMENITNGKFSTALTLLREITSTIANNLKNENEYIDLRVKLGIYLSGITIEKRKRKVEDAKKVFIMSSYFPSLQLEECHISLALSNFMVQCYKNGNFDMAKEIGRKIKPDENTEKMIKKVLKSNKKGNAIEFSEGKFCFDTCTYEKEYLECKFCFVKSKQGKVCGCCEVGYLK